MTRNKGAMTVAEAGRRGGATTAQRHGPEFYEQIGKKGGRTTAARHGSDFYEQIGKQGGQKVKELYGPRFYGLPLNEEKITLERGECEVPNEVAGLVPFHAGETLPWKIAS